MAPAQQGCIAVASRYSYSTGVIDVIVSDLETAAVRPPSSLSVRKYSSMYLTDLYNTPFSDQVLDTKVTAAGTSVPTPTSKL